jgi:SNF2 family DNA or RNA helicase
MLGECGALKADKSWTRQAGAVREIWRWQPELPATFEGELRDYQWDGFQWLARMAKWGVGACLADEMGLGKTVQALAAALTRAAEGPTLVVAPTSVCENWLREAARFAPTLRCRIYGDAADRDAILADLGPGDLLACSYARMALDADRLVTVQWQGVILDEAQAIKNRETLRARSVARLKSHYRIATTGTPVENHLGELWSLFHFLNPGLLGKEREFRQRYQNAAADTDPASLHRLKSIVRPFILRRTKSAVLVDLPPRTDIVVAVRPEPD